MNAEDLRERLNKAVINRAEAIIEEKAKTFAALLKYEIAVANTELAMTSDKHGYDFQFIPESYADGVVIGRTETNSESVNLKLSIPLHVFKNASDGEVQFFKTYIVANVIKKLQHES